VVVDENGAVCGAGERRIGPEVLEAFNMEIVIFFVFIAVCAFALVWASKKTKSEADLQHQKRLGRNKSRAEKLVAPRDSLLAHNDQVWQSRRQHAHSGIVATNKFVPKSEDSGTPEYDGYSRRDRHHVTDQGAQVMDEHREEDFTMTAIEFEADEQKTSKKAAS
jgi:hypothetical protein